MRIGRTLVGAVGVGAAAFGTMIAVQTVAGAVIATVVASLLIVVAIPVTLIWINR